MHFKKASLPPKADIRKLTCKPNKLLNNDSNTQINLVESGANVVENLNE